MLGLRLTKEEIHDLNRFNGLKFAYHYNEKRKKNYQFTSNYICRRLLNAYINTYKYFKKGD
jgi:hypothetical protein